MSWIAAGIIFGFLGSFHCIGMCGPLALSLPGKSSVSSRFIISRLLYNSGRVATYMLLGGLVGLFSRVISFSGYQQWLSIAVGILLVLSLVFTRIKKRLARWQKLPTNLISSTIQPIKVLLNNNSFSSLFVIGLLNGLLPCGFVYMALATAVTAGTIQDSMIFMMGFGMGTVPAMFTVSMARGLVSFSAREKMQAMVPYFIASVGILLILRGLGLGIPFLSPSL